MNTTRSTKKSAASHTRRTWSAHEEKELIVALKELVTKGYKSDNRFRTGYLHLVEQHFRQRFPGTDIKAEPHISNKIHNWKKCYTSLSLMFGTSGIGLGANFMIDVQDDVWDNYIKRDQKVKTMRYKTWPYFNDWIEIFDKDRATGESAQGFADGIKDFLNTANNEPIRNDFILSPMFDNEKSSKASTSNNYAESTNTSKRCGKSKHRRVVNSQHEDHFMLKINEYCEQNNKLLGDIATYIGDIVNMKKSKLDLTEKRMKVYIMLEGFDFLNLKARVHVARYLCNHEVDLDLFMSIPDDARVVLVKDIMDKI